MKSLTTFRATAVEKLQVQRIRLLERLKRDNKNKKTSDQIISSLQAYEFSEDINLSNI